MSTQTSRRHRVAGRYNPVASLSTAFARSAKPAAKVSAVMAVSGGMVASFGLPAGASPQTSAPSAASATSSAAVDELAIAPPTQTTLAARAFGQVGFTPVTKPKPLPLVDLASRAADPRPARATSSRVSRYSSRAAMAHRSSAPAASGVIGIARSLLGIYYVYGGTTPAGFDCSGFTQYVFGRAGISLPRTAEAQRQATTRVSSPQPGDLVFFGSPAYHVGIYVGNGMMIDSPHTGAATSQRAVYSSAVTYGRP